MRFLVNGSFYVTLILVVIKLFGFIPTWTPVLVALGTTVFLSAILVVITIIVLTVVDLHKRRPWG